MQTTVTVTPDKPEKCKADVTRCLVCGRSFADEVPEYVYRESVLLGAIHEMCYELVMAQAGPEPLEPTSTLADFV